uniref:Uncharacterized protein n=1 Tax=Solanum lycopersicum TaxID=4081 RepID=K4BVP0_SOLLC
MAGRALLGASTQLRYVTVDSVSGDTARKSLPQNPLVVIKMLELVLGVDS